MARKPKMPTLPGMKSFKDAEKANEDAAAKPMRLRGMPNYMQRANRPGGMKKGGAVHADAAQDRKLIRQEIARAEKAEGEGMKKGGKVSPFGKAKRKKFF